MADNHFHHFRISWFHEIVGRASADCSQRALRRIDDGTDDDDQLRPHLQSPLQNSEPGDSRQDQIEHDDVDPLCTHDFQCLFTTRCANVMVVMLEGECVEIVDKTVVVNRKNDGPSSFWCSRHGCRRSHTYRFRPLARGLISVYRTKALAHLVAHSVCVAFCTSASATTHCARRGSRPRSTPPLECVSSTSIVAMRRRRRSP